MPSKKDVQKRRLAASEAAEAQARAASARDRRKRWTVGLVGGGLALMLVLSLAGGALVLLFDDDGNNSDPPALEIEPAVIRPIAAGAVLTGPTPCPDTDGTQVRTTSFEQAPDLCIDPDLDYEVLLATAVGDITVTVDSSLDETAANLFVTMARYGLYDDMPFNSLVPEGLAVVADPDGTDQGFNVVPATPSTAYEVGSVIMLADLSDRIASQFAFIATPRVAESLELVHPVVGSVTAGQEVVDAIIAIGSSVDTSPAPIAEIRVVSATVTEVR